MVRKAEEKKKPQKAPEPPKPSLDTKIAGIAVDAAKSARDSALAAAEAIRDVARNTAATSADIAALTASVDRLVEVMMMSSRVEVSRDNRNVIEHLDVHKIERVEH